MRTETIVELGNIIGLDYLIKLSEDKFEINLDINKNFIDNDFDELDMAELIMEIEKQFDIYLDPTLEEILVDDKNFIIKDMFVSELRNSKLNDLGINDSKL
jgi:acyl carrier protein